MIECSSSLSFENSPRLVSDSSGKTQGHRESFGADAEWFKGRAKLLFNHRLMEGIEDAVYERAGILPGEFLGEVDRFVEDDLGRRVGGAQLVHGEAQDGAIDSGEAVEAPVFRVLDDDFIQHGHFFCCALA